jgi:chromosome segregation ATPase
MGGPFSKRRPAPLNKDSAIAMDPNASAGRAGPRDVDDARTMIAQLRKETLAAQRKLAIVEREKANEIANLTEENQKKDFELANLQSMVVVLKDVEKNSDNYSDKLEQQLDNALADKRRMSMGISKAVTRITKLEQDLENADRENTRLTEKLAEKESELTKLKQEMDDAVDKKSLLEQLNAENEGKIIVLEHNLNIAEDKINALEQDHLKATAENTSLKPEQTKTNAEITELKVEKEKAVAKISTLEQDKANADVHYAVLKKEMQANAQMLAVRNAEFAALKEEKKAADITMHLMANARTDEIARLKQELAERSDEIATLKLENGKAQGTRSVLELTILKFAMVIFRDERTKMYAEEQQLQEKITSLLNTNDKLITQLLRVMPRSGLMDFLFQENCEASHKQLSDLVLDYLTGEASSQAGNRHLALPQTHVKLGPESNADSSSSTVEAHSHLRDNTIDNEWDFLDRSDTEEDKYGN